MGLFDFLKGKQPIVDEFFGPLTKYKEPEGEVFSCTTVFAPLNLKLDLIMDALGEQSTSEQKSFYKKVEAQYNVLLSKIELLVAQELKSIGADYTVKDFSKEYELAAMDMPKLDRQPLKWSLTYLSTEKGKADFRVDFKDFEPQPIDIILSPEA